jgi:arylsulfatase A-like enzyme
MTSGFASLHASSCGDSVIGAGRFGSLRSFANPLLALELSSAPQLVFLRRLFLPLAVYATVLKTHRLYFLSEHEGFAPVLDGWRSEPAFFLALFCGFAFLFTILTGRRARRLLTAGAVTAALITGTLETAAHYFYSVTGSAVDWVLVDMFFRRLPELCDVVASEGGVIRALYISLPIPIAAVALKKRPGEAPPPTGARRRYQALFFLAGATIAAVLAVLPSSTLRHRDLDRNATLQVVTSMIASLREPVSAARFDLPAMQGAHLLPRETPRWKNLVVVMLESTRASATTPYNPELETTPFMRELAEQSLLAERTYAIVPHTSKATVAVLCGTEPHFRTPITESEERGIATRCLPELLSDQGYESVYMMPHIADFEDWNQLVANLGFDEFIPLEKMGDTSGFEWAHYFGMEDDIMLEPTRKWLEEHGEEPFFVTYLTATPHHDYRAPKRYGRHAFVEEETFNRYLNAVHYQDHFLRNLFDLYRELGLYEETVFVLVGDHGEAFYEHGRMGHSNVPYEEGLTVPFLVHAPGAFHEGPRVPHIVNHLDVLPTAISLLGFELQGGVHEGRPVWQADPERTTRFHCWMERECAGSVHRSWKYVHHFGERPDELFDLSSDPGERVNLSARFPQRVATEREAVLRWRRDVNAAYEAFMGREGLARFLD